VEKKTSPIASKRADLIPQDSSFPLKDLALYLETQKRKGVLRLFTCGSIGAGKSTLIDRLLQESNFATNAQRLLVTDIPVHEQLTRIVTAASTADVGVVVVDARKGLLPETRRHTYLASLLGLRRLVLAVNKLDLVGYARDVFESIRDGYLQFAGKLEVAQVTCIPLCALRGDNVVSPSGNMSWYRGPTLLGCLETGEVDTDLTGAPLRMLVQSISEPNQGLPACSGRIVGGTLRAGDRVRAAPSGRESTVKRIVSQDGDLEAAVAGESVTVMLADELDIGRGDVLSAADAPPEVADQFEAQVIWLGAQPMLPGRPYRMKIGEKTVGATITKPKYKVNIDTMEHLAATRLEPNEIGACNLHLDQTIAFDPYEQNRDTGGFILLDRLTNHTLATGMLRFALRRSHNIHWQAIDIGKQAHAALKGQHPCIVWFTGLSGAGKSTIANVVEKKLHAMGRHTFLLDGDNVRHGLNKDLGFTEADRVENIRRVAEVAKLMMHAGLIVLVSFISPFRAERRFARELVEKDEFCEVFVDVPLEVAEQRDRKGLYKKARRGELKNFTGIDSPYEPPEAPEIHIDTTRSSAEDAADRIVHDLSKCGVLRDNSRRST